MVEWTRLRELGWAGASVFLLAASLALWAVLAARSDPAPPTARAPLGQSVPGTQAAGDLLAGFPKDIQAAALLATVRIRNTSTRVDGSGAIIKRKGDDAYVLTANHVVAGAERVEIAVYTPKSYPKPAHVYPSAVILASSATADLAVVSFVTQDTLPGVARLCPPNLAPHGAFPVLTVGCDGGDAPTCLADKVLGETRPHKPGLPGSPICWEMSHRPGKGRSGGPAFDTSGRVIGVASGAGDDKGYYIHAAEIYEFLSSNKLKWLYDNNVP